jgi:hypothetical protein
LISAHLLVMQILHQNLSQIQLIFNDVFAETKKMLANNFEIELIVYNNFCHLIFVF